MSEADWIKLVVGAILTAGLTLGGQVFVARYQHRRVLERDRMLEEQSRERVQWDELRAHVKPLMDTAGKLTTHLGGWAMYQHADEIKALLRELNTYPEQFADYPDVRAVIWDFQNTVNIILDDQSFFLTDKEREFRADRAAMEPPETPEEREKRVREERNMREVQLPQTYRALVATAKALYESPPLPPARPSGWRRFISEVAAIVTKRRKQP